MNGAGTDLDGEKALGHYQNAQSAAAEAKSYRPAQGYDGSQIMLGAEADGVLEACVRSADAEIRRRRRHFFLLESGGVYLADGKAEEAVGEFQQALEEGLHDAETTKAKQERDRADREVS